MFDKKKALVVEKPKKSKSFFITLLICIFLTISFFAFLAVKDSKQIKETNNNNSAIYQNLSPIHNLSEEELGLDKAITASKEKKQVEQTVSEPSKMVLKTN